MYPIDSISLENFDIRVCLHFSQGLSAVCFFCKFFPAFSPTVKSLVSILKPVSDEPLHIGTMPIPATRGICLSLGVGDLSIDRGSMWEMLTESRTSLILCR